MHDAASQKTLRAWDPVSYLVKEKVQHNSLYSYFMAVYCIFIFSAVSLICIVLKSLMGGAIGLGDICVIGSCLILSFHIKFIALIFVDNNKNKKLMSENTYTYY